MNERPSSPPTLPRERSEPALSGGGGSGRASEPRGAKAAKAPRDPIGVVFDLDGTLVDSREDIAAAARFALAAHGARDRSVEEIATFVGDGARMLLSRAASLPVDDARLDEFVATFTAYYAEHATDRTRMLPEATTALDALRAHPLALCTNKPRVVTDRVLRSLGISPLFAAVVAGGDGPFMKPHPAPLQRIARQLGLAPARLVMVGDGVQDIECGRAAGAHTVAVLGGFSTEERLRHARPGALIRTLAELPALVRTF